MKATLISLALSATIASAFSGTHKIPPDEGIATVVIPDKWQTKEQGEIVEAISPDGSVYFLIIPAERKIAESIGEAMRYIRWRGEIVVDPKSLRQKSAKLNGVDAQFISWKGKSSRGAVEIQYRIFALEPGEPLLAAFWGAPDEIAKNQSALDKILQSVRKAAREKSQDRQ